MAAIDQINVNIGTEQSPNYVLHDVNDKRISSTAVTTATHLLATDASLSAINPITAANLASVLGAHYAEDALSSGDLNNVVIDSCRVIDNRSNGISNAPSGFTSMGILTVTKTKDTYGIEQRLYGTQSPNNSDIYYRYKWGNNWSGWKRNDNYGTTSLSELASALGGQLGNTPISLGKGETHTITGLSDVTILVIKKNNGDVICLVLKSWTHCVVLGDTDVYVTSDVEGKVCLTAFDYGLSIKSNIDGTNNFVYSIVKRIL